jgi:glycerol-3-phosphate acyltransferase PlsY
MPWLIVTLGYFIGSIPTAYIAGRLLKGKDIRQMGDANMGAANAFRQLGAKVGVTVGIIDAVKGTLAVVIAQLANVPQLAVLATGVAVVVGHNWPVFLHFRGGRGEATTIGVLLAIVTLPMLIIAAPAIAAHLILRDTMKAAPFIFVPLPLLCWWLEMPGILIAYSIALPCLVGFTHFLRARQAATRRA